MSAHLSTTDTRHSSAPVGDFARLGLALVLSAGAHLLFAQLLPQSVKPYEGAASRAGSPLTVTLQSKAPSGAKATVPMPPQLRPDEPVDGAARRDETPPSLALVEKVPPDASSGVPSRADQTALPLLDYYYASREVDSPAQAVGDGLLVYPREALALRISGEVKLRLFIDESGNLVRYEVVSGDPPGIFEEAAAQAVGTMRFSPARKAQRPVRSQRTVQITFDPNPAEHSESATQ